MYKKHSGYIMEFVIQKAVLKRVPFQLYVRVRLRAAARIIYRECSLFTKQLDQELNPIVVSNS